MIDHEKELAALRRLYDTGAFAPRFYSCKLSDRSLLDSYEQFCTIPFTYKREIRETSIWERSTTRPGEVYGVFSSSGTTGQKTFYIYNKTDKAVHEHFVRSFFKEFDITPKDIGGVMAPVDTGVMAHTMMWEFTTIGAGYVNCPVPTAENMIDTVTRVPVTVIATRPGVASAVAYNSVLLEKARSSGVRMLLMGGGFLSNERRKLLEYAWDAKCYNLFGMSEVFGPMAAECRMRDGLHYPDEYLLVEVIDPNTMKPVADGETGIAVYTTLWDKGFPLLRYWTDDLVRVTHEPCACGSHMPRMYFLGRLGDCFATERGYVFPENVENILFRHGHIGEYCVTRTGDCYSAVSESRDCSDTGAAEQELCELFGAHVKLRFVTPGSLRYDGHAKRFSTES